MAPPITFAPIGDQVSRLHFDTAGSAVVASLLSKQRQDVMRLLGNPPEFKNIPKGWWADAERDMAKTLLPLFRQTFMQADHRLTQELGGDAGMLTSFSNAQSWAEQQAEHDAKGITATTKKWLQDALAKYDKKKQTERLETAYLLLLMMGVFGPYRSSMIGVTSTTRGITAGELAAVDRLTEEGPEGARIVRPGALRGDWATGLGIGSGSGGEYEDWELPPDEEFEDVIESYWVTMPGCCEVCEKLDGQPRAVWSKVFPNGPPAPHPHCRCKIRWYRTRQPLLPKPGNRFFHWKMPKSLGFGGLLKAYNPDEARDKSGKWTATGSAAFKAWFGDSKVVDADGKPLVVFHGTDQEFNEFKTGTHNAWTDSLGFDTYFFSEGKAVATTYANQFANGRVMECYLSIQNPLVIDAHGGEWIDAISEASDLIRTYRTPEEKAWLEKRDEYESKYAYELEYDPDSIPKEETDEIEEAQRAMDQHVLRNKKLYSSATQKPYKYDGIVVKNVLDMTAAPVDEEIGEYSPYTTVYIPFERDQIKSAIRSGYTRGNPDITKAFDPNEPRDKSGRWTRGETGVTENDETNRRRKPRAKPDQGRSDEASRRMAGQTQSSGNRADGKGRANKNQSASAGTHQSVPAKLEEVNKRLDRVADLFRRDGQHEQADWIERIKSHVNDVGVKAALGSLGAELGGGKQKVQYVGTFDDFGGFAEQYLKRTGIVVNHLGHRMRGKRVISSEPEASRPFDANRRGEYQPHEPTIPNKLEEAKHLPGLETSEDIGKVVGRKVTHLTPEVMRTLDAKYGKGKWIVKAYGEDAAGGFGIYFPQHAAALRNDARNAIAIAKEGLKQRGYSLARNARGRLIGVADKSGRVYEFGGAAYNRKMKGIAREYADSAAEFAPDEYGAKLAGGGRDYMVQPAFSAVGVSDKERASGTTIAPGEGRVHLITRRGKAEIVQHATWIKGEDLPVVFETKDTRAMAQAALDAINKLPASERQGQVYASDVIKTKHGYRVVEANPSNYSGGSGYLTDNPFVIDSYVSQITKQDPYHVRFIRSLLAKHRGHGIKKAYDPDEKRGEHGRWAKGSDYNAHLARYAAEVAESHGFDTQISDSKSTSSSYLSVGYVHADDGAEHVKGGFHTIATLRVSNHPKPGWSRGGWISRLRTFDLRPRSEKTDKEKITTFLAKLAEDHQGEIQKAFNPDEARDAYGKWTADTARRKELDERNQAAAKAMEHIDTFLTAQTIRPNSTRKVPDASAITTEQAALYRRSCEQVLNYMNKKACERLIANTDEHGSGIRFYPDSGVLSMHVAWEMRQRGVVRNVSAVGAWIHVVGQSEGILNLDGGADTNEDTTNTTREVYAHEFGHVLDNVPATEVAEEYGTLIAKSRQISDGTEWKDAWNSEINTPEKPLSDYACKSESEGFAEFSRLLLSGDTRGYRDYPKCYAVWKKEGLI